MNVYREQCEKVAAASVVARKSIIVENCSNSLYPGQAKQNHKILNIPTTILAIQLRNITERESAF